MKRFFSVAMATTFLCATTAHAQHVHGINEVENEGLSIKGFHDFQASVLDQDIDRGQRDFKFANDTEVHIHYMGKAEQGFWYGATIELEADVTDDFRGEGLNADKTYLFVQSDQFGRVEAGANTDAAALLEVNATTFARGSGGPHGDWFHIVSFPAMSGAGHGAHGSGLGAHAGHGDFIHTDTLPLHHSHGATEDANKVTYISPRIQGVQTGVSFIPDSGDAGTAAGFTGATGHREFENILSGGVNYTGKVGEVGVLASLTGQYGKEEVPNHNDLKAYAAGINFSYRGVTVGGSYGDWNKSLTHPAPTVTDSQYWSGGIAYETGPVGVSLTYLDSEYQRNELQATSVAVDYTLAAGLVPYAEVHFLSLDAADPMLQDNDATAFIFGTQLNF